ncbi:MAG: glycosyltransferase [Bacteroidetes bacterium]|nr:MAG: glycosyltransferase [Bacteroidota bacterium]
MYNLGIVVYALVYRYGPGRRQPSVPVLPTSALPPVAILYTTCNDFVEESAASCVRQDYPHYTVYVLDDSSDPDYQAQVDAFAAAHPDRVQVVRRTDRAGFKAGNMNHGLSRFATEEPYFAIADADEILPPDFLRKLVPIMETDPQCGFVQANHRANPGQTSPLAQALGVGIDLHWQWYQPLRNRYGFVMFLGHGALLRRRCWEEIGGFPDIVSEDLGFAIRIRERGYRGRFEESVVCYEDFPDTVRAFRIRHMKWTRGTCEFLYKEALPLVRSRHISWMEKLDILFPTMNLPLTLFYLFFMLNANLLMPTIFGQEQPLTLSLGGEEVVLPILTLESGFNQIFTLDFFLITLLTFLAPVMCFILGLAHRPGKLFRFLSHSTALYAALGPLSSMGVLSFAITRKAIFLVTGDKQQGGRGDQRQGLQPRRFWTELLGKSHPDHWAIQGVEVLFGLGFAWVCLRMMQVSFLGLCLAFILLPLMHHLRWEHRLVRGLVYVPFALIVVGLMLGGMSAFGMSTVFFGYGFHF